MKNKLLKFLIITLFALFTTNSANADFSFSDIELRFAQFSDTHITDSNDTTYKALSQSKKLLNAAIEDVNKFKGLDFVVFTGDMVNEPKKEYYKDFLTALTQINHTPLLVLGNHDATKESKENDYLTKDEIIDIIKKSNPYQQYDTPYFAFSPNDSFRVIILDTTMGYEFASNGFIDDVQLQFLDDELTKYQDKVVLIFQHHPVIEPFKSNHHKLLNANAYFEILKKHPLTPIAIFSGHYHAANVVKENNVVHFSTPSLVTYPNAFRTVLVTNYKDRVIFNYRLHETRYKKIQEKCKSSLIASQLFDGTSNDRSGEIMIRKGVSIKQKEIYKEVKEQEKAYKEAEKEAKENTKKAQDAVEKEIMELQELMEKR